MKIIVIVIFSSILELYLKYGKDKPEYNGSHCVTDIDIGDFINAMSVLYYKGHFILGAEFSESYQESCLSILNKLSPPINDGKSLYLFLLRLTGSVSMRCIPMLELRWGCARLSSPW